MPADWRLSMYYRYYYSHFKTEPHFGIRTQTHKLIYFDRIDQWEMYDLVHDPIEIGKSLRQPRPPGTVAWVEERIEAAARPPRG